VAIGMLRLLYGVFSLQKMKFSESENYTKRLFNDKIHYNQDEIGAVYLSVLPSAFVNVFCAAETIAFQPIYSFTVAVNSLHSSNVEFITQRGNPRGTLESGSAQPSLLRYIVINELIYFKMST
jgi:hypothetical protein